MSYDPCSQEVRSLALKESMHFPNSWLCLCRKHALRNLMTLQLVNSVCKIASYLDCNERLLCHCTCLIYSIDVWMWNCMNGAWSLVACSHNTSGYHNKWCRTEFLGIDCMTPNPDQILWLTSPQYNTIVLYQVTRTNAGTNISIQLRPGLCTLHKI